MMRTSTSKHSICNEFEIHFLAFLQPILSLKSCIDADNEKEIIVNSSEYDLERSRDFFKEVKCQLNHNKYDYIYDFTSIFDADNVYIDECHVNEKGNGIIADRIFSVLKETEIIENKG